MIARLHLAALMLVLGCGTTGTAATPASEHGQPGGHLVLIGGGAKPEAAMRLFVELGGGAEGRFVIMPLASGDSRDTGAYYIELLRKYGARKVEVVHVDDRRDALRATNIAAVAGATGVWFSGGDQRRITSRLVGTPLLEALVAMKQRGGVVGGTSAGTACQSHIMLTGDGDVDTLKSGNIAVSRGLGLAPDSVIIDQHFVARRRQNRLLSVLLENPGYIGIGVDEGTAAWFRPDGTVQAVGDGWLMIFDATAAAMHENAGKRSARGIALHILANGERFAVPPVSSSAP